MGMVGVPAQRSVMLILLTLLYLPSPSSVADALQA